MSSLISRQTWYTEKDDSYVSFAKSINISQCKRVKVVLCIGDQYTNNFFSAFDNGVFATIKISALNGLGGIDNLNIAKTSVFGKNTASVLELDFKIPENMGSITGYSIETLVACSVVNTYDTVTTIEYYDY